GPPALPPEPGHFLPEALQILLEGDHLELAADDHFLELLQVQDLFLQLGLGLLEVAHHLLIGAHVAEDADGTDHLAVRIAQRRACSSSRMSRRMPMAPIILPPGSRSAEALRLAEMTSPLALRGLSRAFRVTPRSTTSRKAARNSRVSAGEMMRESDCSISSS